MYPNSKWTNTWSSFRSHFKIIYLFTSLHVYVCFLKDENLSVYNIIDMCNCGLDNCTYLFHIKIHLFSLSCWKEPKEVYIFIQFSYIHIFSQYIYYTYPFCTITMVTHESLFFLLVRLGVYLLERLKLDKLWTDVYEHLVWIVFI